MRTMSSLCAAVALGLVGSAARAEDGLGKMEVVSANGQDSLRFMFTAQLRTVYEDLDGGPDAPRSTSEEVVLQRVRPILQGRFLERKLSFALQLNTGPTQLELLDLYLDYAFSSELRVRAGQLKVPFTRHRLGSFSRLTFVDWSAAARFFGAERQLGLMVHGDPPSAGGLEYAVGAFAGTNVRSAFERGPSRIYGAPLPNPSDLSDPAAPSQLHPELVGRVGWRHGEDRFDSDSDAAGGPPRVTAGLSVAHDFAPEVGRDFATRVAPEVLLKLYHVSLGAVGYAAFFKPSTGRGQALGALGAQAQASFRPFAVAEVALRYSYVEVLGTLRDDAKAWAAAQAEGVVTGRPGALEHQHDLTVALNGYLVGDQLKVQAEYGLGLSRRSGVGRTDHVVLTQLQVAF